MAGLWQVRIAVSCWPAEKTRIQNLETNTASHFAESFDEMVRFLKVEAVYYFETSVSELKRPPSQEDR
jgi:hypothetical protein